MSKDTKRTHMGMREKTVLSNTVIYIVLILMTVIWLIPFVCILFESFRIESTWQVGYVLPQQWALTTI